jgi:hypothetical protein
VGSGRGGPRSTGPRAGIDSPKASRPDLGARAGTPWYPDLDRGAAFCARLNSSNTMAMKIVHVRVEASQATRIGAGVGDK